MPASEVLKATAATRQRVFPVMDGDGLLLGCFHVADLLHLLHDAPAEARQRLAADLVVRQDLTLAPADAVATAQRIMTARGVEELLITRDEDPRSVLGILTSTDVLLAYNRRLAQVEDPTHVPAVHLDEPLRPPGRDDS